MYKPYKRPLYSLINFFGKRVERKHFTKPPIYIGGCGRSGTTLLLSIISAHPEIFCCREELGLFENLRETSKGKIPLRLDRLYLSFLRYPKKDTHNRWCEKTPRNVRRLDLINDYHKGNFQFINLVRDGRNVVLSKHPDGGDKYWVDPDRWVLDVGAPKDYLDDPRVLTVKYEDLLGSFEKEIRRICEFLNVPASDEILNWHKHAEVRENRALFSEIRPISDKDLNKWRRPEFAERVAEFMSEEGAKELLELYQYPS